MSKKTPQQIAEKYQRGVAGAGNDYATGVQSPNKSWASATQASAARWGAGIQQAIQAKSFETGVQKAGDQKWQTNALNKGAQRYTAAAGDAAAAYAQVADRVMGAAAAAQAAVANMPNTSLEQRLARSAAAARAISAYHNGGKVKG
jgi:hypothetical protein